MKQIQPSTVLRLPLQVHGMVLKPYTIIQELEYCTKPERLTNPTRDALLRNHRIKVTRVAHSNQFAIVDGFQNIGFSRYSSALHFACFFVIPDSKLNWHVDQSHRNTLSFLLQTMNPKSLAQFHAAINTAVPKHIIEEFFDKPSLSQTHLAELTQVNRSTLGRQSLHTKKVSVDGGNHD